MSRVQFESMKQIDRVTVAWAKCLSKVPEGAFFNGVLAKTNRTLALQRIDFVCKRSKTFMTSLLFVANQILEFYIAVVIFQLYLNNQMDFTIQWAYVMHSATLS